MDVGKKRTTSDLIREVEQFIAKPEVYERFIGLLKEYDILRMRSYIQREVDNMISGKLNRWGLSYRIHRITELDFDITNSIAQKIFQNVLPEVLQTIDQIYALSEKERELQDTKNKEEAYITRPLEIADIFNDSEEETDDAIQVVEMDVEAPELKRVTLEQEENAVNEMLDTVTLELTEDQKNRLRNVMRSRIKNIRDAVDTRLALTRSLDTGGVGLHDKDAGEVSLMVEDYVKHNWPPPFNPSIPVVKENKPAVPKTIESLVQKEEVSVAATDMFSNEDKKTAFENTLKKRLTETGDNTIQEKRKAVLDTINKSDTQDTSEKVETKTKKSFFSKKPKPPRLVGPADELRDLTIDDWRGLYSSQEDAIRSIESKIQRLGKDSFRKKIEGIKAWREGQIMNLYLNIGKRSINEKKSIKEVVDDLKTNGQQYLTDDEFHAIMKLNKEIRMMA